MKTNSKPLSTSEMELLHEYVDAEGSEWSDYVRSILDLYENFQASMDAAFLNSLIKEIRDQYEFVNDNARLVVENVTITSKRVSLEWDV